MAPSLFRSSDCYTDNRCDEDVALALFGSSHHDFKSQSYDCDDQESMTSATDDCSSSSSSSFSECLQLVASRSTCNFGSEEDESSSKSFNSKSFRRRRRRMKFKGSARKTVSFSGFDELYEIDPIDDDLIDSYYGSEEELLASKDRCRLIAKAISDGRIDDIRNRRVCIRGIEKYTSLGTYKRKYLKRQLYDVVHDIQEMQESFGQDLSLNMGQLCEKISSNSVIDALEYAKEDALYVQSMYSDDQ